MTPKPAPIVDVYVSASGPHLITAIVATPKKTYAVRWTSEGWHCQCGRGAVPCRHVKAVEDAVTEAGQSESEG